MKRIIAFSLAIIVFALSIIIYLPDITFANDAFIISKNSDEATGLSSDEAQKAIDANADIRGKDGVTMLLYTPSDSYNYTFSNYGLTFHMSDAQAKAMLMSKKTNQQFAVLVSSFLSNNSVIRGFVSSVGALSTGDSSLLTRVLDNCTTNYNYLDSLNYDEDSQTITMSNDNGSVDKLREEIKKYYYDLIGLNEWKASGTVKEWVDSPTFRKSFDYEEDYNNGYGYSQYNYVICSGQYFSYFFNEADLFYISNDERINLTVDNWAVLFYKVYFYNKGSSSSSFIPADKAGLITHYQYTYHDVTECALYRSNSYGFAIYPSPATWSSETSKESSRNILLYSKDKKPLKYFSSYGALYNYMHGDQNAYLSSKIEETGKDISYSIKDMNENLGTKMDELIDSINSGKGNMSADELQNAIDKGLDELNKNTEDIKDNTSSILDKLEEQNQILLQILGVTEYIAYQTTKDDGSSYTKTDLTNTINKIYNGLGNAILYGKNTLTDSGDSSGAASQSYIVTREDFKLSNNIYTSSGSGVSPGTPVVAYSLDDYSVYDDSNDYDVGIAAQDINNMDIHDGLFGKFPFSVPYQLYEWLQVLQADPVAPKLVYNYGFLLGHKDDQKYDLVIDFNIYEPWANVCKSFLRLSFTLAMSLFLYKKFKGNSIF